MKKAVVLILGLSLSTYAAGAKMSESFLQTQIKCAVDLLQKHLGDTNTSIETMSAEKVTWRNSALGCPRSDLNYMSVLTPGVRIVLSVNDTQYFFHGNNKQSVFLCDSATRQQPYALEWQNNQSDN